MIFNEFSVDNIWGLRRYFSIGELIRAIDTQYALGLWFGMIKGSGTLQEEEFRIVDEIQHNFKGFVKEEECTDWGEFALVAKENPELAEKMSLWEKKIDQSRIHQYRNFCMMILRFLLLSECVISRDSAEEETVLRYLLDEGYIKTSLLELKRISSDRLGIFYRKKMVTEMHCQQALLHDDRLLFEARHPDTGFIGIDQSGKIMNRSAFYIPNIEKKAVKVAVSQAAFVILMENGKLVHNLKFTDLPEVPVKNIELQGEQLKWQFMDC